MKTAISVPDLVFNRIETRVKVLGLSRSEFFSRAAQHYLVELDRTDLTARLDEAIATNPPDRAEQVEWTAAGLGSLAAATEGDEW